MVTFISSDSNEEIELDSFIEFVNGQQRRNDQERLIEAADYLKALSNNRMFLSEIITSELKNIADLQLGNAYSSQVMLLGAARNWLVRANFWPSAQDSIYSATGADAFFYNVPHDHNFDFLTVGYSGPGYESDFYEYENDQVVGLSLDPCG